MTPEHPESPADIRLLTTTSIPEPASSRRWTPPDAHTETPRSGPRPHAAPRPNAAKNPRSAARRIVRWAVIGLLVVLGLALIAALTGRHLLRKAVRDSLPQLDGTLTVSGLAAPVTVTRDAHGVPSIHAQTLDDLVFAQGFITASDRLFQMDSLRRHAAGELAEVLGASLLPHDRAQRILSLGPAADRLLAGLPADQRRALDRYAAGVNAAIAVQSAHLPVEFRLLAYQPRPWTPRDSVLVSMVLFQDLTNSFPTKLNREALTARLAPTSPPELRAQLLADLYPVGSWRDHPPSVPATDLTQPTDFIEIPLDDSQAKLHRPTPPPGVPFLAQLDHASGGTTTAGNATPQDLAALAHLFAPAGLLAGSNSWAVDGTHTASGRPLLSNDMHLNLTAPGIWYTVNLRADQSTNTITVPFHISGLSIPGAPFVIVGQNDHLAWGFTNLGADVQDLYVEHLRNPGPSAEFQQPEGAWLPVRHRSETIRVRGGHDLTLDIQLTQHGGAETPIVTPLLPSETRPVALRWTLFDTAGYSLPLASADSATTLPELAQSFSTAFIPPLNLIAADSAGHISYHALGRIPLRGPVTLPTALSPVPLDATAPDAAAHEWTSAIPFDQLPATTDPPGGVLATANARITPDTYAYAIALNWAGPYRNERIWRTLTGTHGLTPADMLRLQTDTFSDSDQRIAHRLAYAVDHTPNVANRTRLAADLLRNWNGQVTAGSPAAAINAAARSALWTLLLTPQLSAPDNPATTPGAPPSRSLTALSWGSRPNAPSSAPDSADLLHLYTWGERDFAQEQLIAHLPERWLPPHYVNWDALLTAALEKGLLDAHAPRTLSTWHYGATNQVALELPLFAQIPLLHRLLGLRTGSPASPHGGNGNTVLQSHNNFGPSQRFTADLGDPARSTLNLTLGESGNPASPYFLDQFPAWLHGTSLPLPFAEPAAAHTLTLTPR